MTKPKKSQKPAYVVRSPKKDHRDTSLAEGSHSSRKKLKADLPQYDQSETGNRKSKRDAFRHNIRERHARLKASMGPTRSLMSIDFTSMGLNSLERSTSSQMYTKPQSSNSSDEESQSDRRNDWKRSQGNQNHRESTNHGAVSSSNQGIWRRPRSSNHAPIIVDMRHHNTGIDLQSPNQPKSLLGDYWTSVAPKPTSLMNFKAKDSMGHYTIQQETYSCLDDFTSHLNPLRTLLPGSRGEEPSSKKHFRQSADDSMAPERKSLKTDQCKQVPAELSHRLHVLKNKGHAFVLIPSACATTYLHGRAKVTILKGNVSILNYRLEEGRQYEVFSPTSGSLLALTCTCTDEFKLTREEVRQKLLTFGLSENDKELESIGKSTVALVMLTKLESTMSDYITSFIPYTQLFTAPETREKDAHALKGITLPELGLKLAPMKEMGPMCLTLSHDYEDVLQRLTAQLAKSTSSKAPPIWLCCGAKNSGKSTFCRMLINTALKSVKAVGFLECDVGQTEFSPPATLSFHIIDKPILGQPFCHQRHAERMVFYGEIKAGYDPSMYIKCLKHVLPAYTDLEDKPPLIVNTMGFPEGIGLMLMIDTVQLVQPDLVVQIESHNQAVNFPAITHELVALDEGWTCNKSPVLKPPQHPPYITFCSSPCHTFL
ncbi:polynucleotide 5'-hydroxyl-kinase nol9-like protein [Plakobranchus ocellatus]|uniref:Polynucleotide 5'-hydroxyl-kinase NOL9 n=1 Tax=Plakobranchus ocellatus TaxID=259542 RepID=A0AAV4D8Q8_9GAST|nr:polynucleotide 5'-hydroxyl-kinase nol9-like protein [Plakobranchus ocellatus]